MIDLDKKDPLGDRMKHQYEDRTRYYLPRRTYTIIRIDGKAFHTYTKHCAKPFDEYLSNAMSRAALISCEQFQGVQFAYGQSDEYSFLLTDFDTIRTEAWFDGNIQKIVSVASSIFTAEFNDHVTYNNLANFDARVFTIPDANEVENYFIWRQQDATRNSIQMLAQEHFSHKALHGKNASQLQEMLFQEKGVNWNDIAIHNKRGRVVRKLMDSDVSIKDRIIHGAPAWIIDSTIPKFTESRDYLRSMIPRII